MRQPRLADTHYRSEYERDRDVLLKTKISAFHGDRRGVEEICPHAGHRPTNGTEESGDYAGQSQGGIEDQFQQGGTSLVRSIFTYPGMAPPTPGSLARTAFQSGITRP